SKGKKVVQLQESLVKLGYELPKYGADGDYGKETETAVLQFKEDLNNLLKQSDVSSDLQKLIDALVKAEWKRPSAKP
ncbi:MAG: peptidoglycan-binding protein, partial [Deltaproteobacteria bacterium]|nr:peptidoglycan-binding protein [Deltaproteobacteria bacterium]